MWKDPFHEIAMEAYHTKCVLYGIKFFRLFSVCILIICIYKYLIYDKLNYTQIVWSIAEQTQGNMESIRIVMVPHAFCIVDCFKLGIYFIIYQFIYFMIKFIYLNTLHIDWYLISYFSHKSLCIARVTHRFIEDILPQKNSYLHIVKHMTIC